MVRVVKKITDIENIHTYFEFVGLNHWDDFDRLLAVLTDILGYKLQEKLDGIYSRHCILDKEGFTFKLLYHEDFGNCLCNQSKKDAGYYNHLESVSRCVLSEMKRIMI